MICFCLVGQTNLIAQKAKFKSKSTRVQKTKLPTNYIEPEKRTYDLYAKGSYGSGVDAHQKRIFGWSHDPANPNVKGVVSIYGFTINSPQVKTEAKTKKDKDGNVTDRWTEYHYTNSAKGNGTLYVYGLTNPFKYKAKNKKDTKSKYEERKEAKEAAEKKSLEDNPFLSSEDVAEADKGESDVGTDEGLSGEALPFANRFSVDQSLTVKTKKFRSRSKAYEDYVNNQRQKLFNFRNEYPNQAYRSAISRLNGLYGYTPTKQSFRIRTMKTEKHPEFKTWNDAAQAATTLFKTVKYNKSIAETSTKFDPIIKYYSDMVTKSAGDKKAKKLNRAAFDNLTNIMYYLDRHDDLITIAKSNMESKNLDGMAKRIMEKSMKKKAELLFHNMTTCHVENAEEIAEDEFEVEEAEQEEEEGEGNK